MFDEIVHDFNDGGVMKFYPNLTLTQRIRLIQYLATGPKCPCDKPHTL